MYANRTAPRCDEKRYTSVDELHAKEPHLGLSKGVRRRQSTMHANRTAPELDLGFNCSACSSKRSPKRLKQRGKVNFKCGETPTESIRCKWATSHCLMSPRHGSSFFVEAPVSPQEL